MKSTHASSKWGRLLAATLVALFVLATNGSLSAWVAHAEGSRDLYPSGATGFRANIEWRTSFYGPNNFLRRRTLLQVYADPGEVILLGSSAVGVGLGNIQIYTSDQVTGRIGDETITGSAAFDCVIDQPGQGQITNRAEELAGPQAVSGGGNPGGYVPCYYEVPTDGTGSADNIYWVVFLGPSGANADIDGNPTTGEIDLASPANFDASQNTTVAAWDVTVRSDLTSTQDITGRLFGDYLSMITGGSGRPMDSNLYVLTTDSYRYLVGLRGLDPYGFIVYSNDRGFLNTDGTPLFHDVLADPALEPQQQNQLNALLGNVSLAEPTHHIFFNEPSSETIAALNGGLVDPITPQINSFVFDGVVTGNTTLVGQGGIFNLDINVPGGFQLVISRDGVDFDPTNPANRVLSGVGSTGAQQISWDGLANDASAFPVGSYPARIMLRAGEVHFPLLDVENSMQGGPQYELLNPPDGCPALFTAGCYTGFYDDRGYTTADGTTNVGTPGVELPGNGPPPFAYSDPFTGFDTRSGQRAFGNEGEDGWGDKKGLDLWTFYPTEANTTLNIVAAVAELSITKVPSQVQVQPGNSVQYTVEVHNAGPDAAENVVVTDTLPAGLTFVSTTGCNEDPNGVPTCSLGTIPAGESRTYTILATVNSGATGVIPNTVTVSTDTPESNNENNTAQAQIEVVPAQPPTPTPTRQKEEEEEEPPTSTPVPPAPPTPTPTPLPPAPPVVLLPETGVAPVRTAPAWPFVTFPVLGLLLGWAIYRSRNRSK